MSVNGIVQELESNDVITVTDADDMVSISASFSAEYNRQRDRLASLSEDELLWEFESFGVSRSEAERLVAKIQDVAAFVAVFSLVAEHTSDVETEEHIVVSTVLLQLLNGQSAGEEVPAAFVPVPGDTIDMLSLVFPKLVAHVWQEDCDPCEYMRDRFDTHINTTETDLHCVAVYGPEWAEHLYEEYDVGGAPTTLLLTDGVVDTRFVGPVHEDVVETEIEKLRQA